MFVGAKYYNVEIPANTKTMIVRNENFKSWLYNNNIKFETSGCFECIHYEIYSHNKFEFDAINNALDTIVWYDAICAE